MTRLRPTRAISTLAGLIAAAVLLSSSGCGYCFGPFGCSGGECCVRFQCRKPEDCPAKSKISHSEFEQTTSSELDDPTP